MRVCVCGCVCVWVHEYNHVTDLCVQESLGGDVIPRSLLMADFDATPHLLCALGDGTLFSFQLARDAGHLTEGKRCVCVCVCVCVP